MPERKPDIFLFNPTCEYAVANGQASWQPNRLLRKMEYDLDILPLFLARPEDIILVRKRPSGQFLRSLAGKGIRLPSFVLLSEAIKEPLPVKSINRLLPWGWSPAAHKILAPLKLFCSEEFKKSPVSKWDPGQREIRSKKFAMEILKQVLPQLSGEWVLPPEMLPQVCTTRAHIEKLISQWGQVMVKAPWSSSGRGLQPITRIPVVEKVWEKLTGIINDQGYAMVEPLLKKELDLALQFEVKKEHISFLGISWFLTDRKGQYQGNILEDRPERLPSDVMEFAGHIPEIVTEPLIRIIEASSLPQKYEGNFGVDMLIFRDRSGSLRINPCLEINVRQNMGLLSLHLKNWLYAGSRGIFHTFFNPEKSFHIFSKEMQQNHPLRMKGHKIISGYLPLTEANENSLFGAYLLAESGERSRELI